MPFKPGHKKSGGRTKGVAGKIQTFRLPTILETLEKEDVRPLEILCKWAKDPDPMTSISATKELCKYMYPTLRSVEVKAEVNAKVESSQADAVIDQLYEIISHMSDGSKK
jgi:hypothetical protein